MNIYQHNIHNLLGFRNCTFFSNVPLEANPSNGPQSQEEYGMRVALVLGKVGCEVSLMVNEWF